MIAVVIPPRTGLVTASATIQRIDAAGASLRFATQAIVRAVMQPYLVPAG